MIGIIAGEIIGSPYGKANLPDIDSIFFPLFEDNRVMDPKTYRETVHRASPGRLTDTVLEMFGSGSRRSGGGTLGEALCGAVVTGCVDARLEMGFDEHAETAGTYANLFPDGMREEIVRAADAAYRLSRKLGTGLQERLGYGLVESPSPELVSALLKGQLVAEDDGTYTRGDGKPSDGAALEGAFCAVLASRSWEEAVRRAVALGGDSPLVAALAGGLAEAAFGLPESISFRAREYLDREQTARLDRFEGKMRHLSGGSPEVAREMVDSPATLISVLSLPGRASVYAVPEDRPDIERSIRRVNPDSVFVSGEGMRRMVERLQTRRGSDGRPLHGTYVDSARPELRSLYYRLQDRKLYSPSTLPDGKGLAPLDVRMKARSEFAGFIAKASAVRDEQERRAGHDPSQGHLRFASAWYLDIARDRLLLMKGDTAYGAFGLDEKGRMRVDTSVVGGSFGGEYLQASIENRMVFYRNDGPAEVLARIGEKCLDDGFVPDDENSVKPNMELMAADLAEVDGDIPCAEAVSVDEMGEKTAATRTRSDYGASSEAMTFDERLYGSMHRGAVFTIGHSNLTIGEFVANCRRNGVTVIRDVRSWPRSRAFPHFNGDALKDSLEREGIRYIYNGDVMGGSIRRTELPCEGEGVRFTQSDGGYAARTRENAGAADLTVAFSVDFTTAGERLTAKAAKGKIIQIPVVKGSCAPKAMATDILSCMTEAERRSPIGLNVAGNSMQTFAEAGLAQKDVDGIVVSVMRELVGSGVVIRSVRSGGQSGADEAGIRAAKELGIPAEVHAPKGWLMRGADGKDVFDEYAFKERFIAMPPKYLTYAEASSTEGFRKVYGEIVADARRGERQALMCAETSPSDCHRFACLGFALSHPSLVGRRFDPTEVQHIRRDGSLVSQEALERRVCRNANVEYGENELKAVMEKVAKRIQNPDPDGRGIRLSRNCGRQDRRR